MNNETFRILAKHFGEAEHIQVVFEPGACPATNGQEIILPDDLQAGGDIMLAALLHETGHVAHSDFDVNPDTLPPSAPFAVVNALEDIRIDALTATKYPAARVFAQASLSDLITRKADMLQAEPPAIRAIKGVIMHAAGVPEYPARIYGPEQAAIIAALAAKYIPQAIAAANTKAIIPIAQALALEIMGAMPEQQQQAEQGQGQSGEGQGEPTEGPQGANGTGTGTDRPNAKNAAQKAIEAREKADKAKADYNDEADKAQKAYNEYKNARTQRRTNCTKAGRADWNARRAEQQGATGVAAAERAAQAKATQRAEQYAERETNAGKATEKHRAETQKHLEAYRAAQAEAEQAEQEVQRAIAGAYGRGQGVALTGFESVDLDALRARSDIAVKGGLAEVVKAALIARREQARADETGANINARALPDYRTADPETFFIDQERKEYQTRVAFVLDVSGSMGDVDRGSDSRATMAIDALAGILDAAKAAIHGGAPAEVTLYAFGDNDKTPALRLLDTIDAHTDRKALAQKFYKGREACGSGTAIIPAINLVADDQKEYPDAEHVTIIMTDADFDAYDHQALRNQANLQGRVIFLGFEANLQGRDRAAARAMFGKYNITKASAAPDVLRRAFMDAVN